MQCRLLAEACRVALQELSHTLMIVNGVNSGWRVHSKAPLMQLLDMR
jgi:hypothetical protein